MKMSTDPRVCTIVVCLLQFQSIAVITDKKCAAAEPLSSFGHRQIDQLVDDRPLMKGIVRTDSEVYKLVALHFQQGASGSRVYWDHVAPTSGFKAEHQPEQNDSLAFVRITDSADVSGRDKWCMLVFELENLRNAPFLRKLHARASRNSISRDDYVVECIELEFKALLRTKRVFQRSPIDGSTEKSDPYYTSIVGMGMDFNAYLMHIETRNTRDYRKFYEKQYNEFRDYGRAINSIQK